MNSILKTLQTVAIIAWAALGAMALPGCASFNAATTGNIATDVVTDVLQGAAAASDAFTALTAAQQVMGGHGVSLANIGQYAQAEISAANTSGLTSVVNTLVGDISSQVAQGTAPSTVVSNLTAAQNAVAALPASTTKTNLPWTPSKEPDAALAA